MPLYKSLIFFIILLVSSSSILAFRYSIYLLWCMLYLTTATVHRHTIPQIGPDLTTKILTKIWMIQMLHKNHPRCHHSTTPYIVKSHLIQILMLWEHPHSHFPTHRYASQHVSQCRSTHITTFQLAVIHHGNATSLSPILLSLQTPVSAHNSRNKRRFPSQHP